MGLVGRQAQHRAVPEVLASRVERARALVVAGLGLVVAVTVGGLVAIAARPVGLAAGVVVGSLVAAALARASAPRSSEVADECGGACSTCSGSGSEPCAERMADELAARAVAYDASRIAQFAARSWGLLLVVVMGVALGTLGAMASGSHAAVALATVVGALGLALVSGGLWSFVRVGTLSSASSR